MDRLEACAWWGAHAFIKLQIDEAHDWLDDSDDGEELDDTQQALAESQIHQMKTNVFNQTLLEAINVWEFEEGWEWFDGLKWKMTRTASSSPNKMKPFKGAEL